MRSSNGKAKQLMIALSIGVLSACGTDEDPPGPVPLDETCGDPVGSCQSRTCNPPLMDSPHVEVCSELFHNSNPPTSGPHYPVWAAFGTYDQPVPRGLYVHSMEHGAVVLAYNCELVAARGGDCAALAGELAQLRAARAADPLCASEVHNRIVVTPDPGLDVPFAAAAWGHALKADCVDSAEVEQFLDAHYAMSPENFCTNGVDPADYPSDCGQ